MLTAGRVSVVVAIKNGEPFLGDAIASVRSQTHDDVELIVVDDGSTDDSLALARSLEIDRLIALPANRGVSTARNIGASVASGEFITFLDADDRFETEKIQRQLEFLRKDPECGCVVTDQRISVLGDIAIPAWLETVDRTVGRDGSVALLISLLTRTENLYRSGGFDPDFATAEDTDLLLRLERTGTRVRRLQEPLVVRIVHGGNASYQTALMRRDGIRATRKLKDGTDAVSVVIPVRNGARFLGEAVRSVLGQGAPVEVVIVDDGSTDGTAAVATGLASEFASVQLVSQPALGTGAARNHGVLASRGALLAFLDADDVWLPNKLHDQIALLKGDPGASVAHGWFEEFVSPEATRAIAPRPPSRGPVASDILLHREAFAAVGPFSVDAARPEWVEWWARALEKQLEAVVSPQLGLRRRLHDENSSAALDPRDYLAVIRESVHRREG
jgi:glycosyltransferase involved in cell wall biosynthesis